MTAVEISATALAVGRTEAKRQGLAGRIEWVRADLATWHPSGRNDLVTAAFLHSPVELPREAVLRRAVAAVAPGASPLVVGHGAFPPGSEHDHGVDAPPLPSPDEALEALELPAGWSVVTKALVERRVMRRDQADATLVDTVLRVRRR